MGDHRTPEERRADQAQDAADTTAGNLFLCAVALERIALELEIANRLEMFKNAAAVCAVDKTLAPDLELARVELNAALDQRAASQKPT